MLAKQLKGNLEHPANQKNSGNPKAERKEWPHNLHISPDTVPHMENSLLDRQKIYEREPADPVDDLDVNMATWSMIHLGQDCEVNLTFCQDSSLEVCGTVIQ